MRTVHHPVGIGSRLGIHWEFDNKYFPATIVDTNKDCPHTHTYLYDDGAIERFDLRCSKFLVLFGPIPKEASLAIAAAGRSSNDDPVDVSINDSSAREHDCPPKKIRRRTTQFPAASRQPPRLSRKKKRKKKMRKKIQSPLVSRPLTRGYQKRHMMLFFLMKPKSKHSHYRMNLPNKPKEWLPKGDEELTESVLIVYPPERNYFYNIERLHMKPHASLPVECIHQVIEIRQANNISFRIVDRSNQHSDGHISVDALEASIWYHGDSLSRLQAVQIEDMLIDYLISSAAMGQLTKDGTRQSLKELADNHDLQERILFGYGRAQPEYTTGGTINPAYRDHAGLIMPSLRAKEFVAMPEELRNTLCKLLHVAAEEVKSISPGAFNDDMRGDIFGKAMRKELGIKDGIAYEFPWEYVDILVTCATGLCRHCDHLNDRREGYQHCSVYSYFRTVKGIEYKVSIIMTTRCSVGKAMERIRNART